MDTGILIQKTVKDVEMSDPTNFGENTFSNSRIVSEMKECEVVKLKSALLDKIYPLCKHRVLESVS